MGKRQVLQDISFGQRIAEDEVDELSFYFVETSQWQSIFAGDVDVVYGAKGAGKSAIYSLLLNRQRELARNRIIVIPAENPRGATVFKELVDSQPDITEQQFYNLWKLYFLSLVADQLRKAGILESQLKKVINTLEDAHVLPTEPTLSKLLRSAVDYVRRLFAVESVQGGMDIDPLTGMPTGFKGKISFREPTTAQQSLGVVSVDELLQLVNSVLEQSRLKVWVLLDRLDVAFAESKTLEYNALRALFRVYNDLKMYNQLCFKIFLRSDIWRLITKEGFTGASHITHTVTISWDEESLLNLVIRRALNNQSLREFYGVSEEILSSAQKQSDLFYRIFPLQVDKGSNRPPTFKWMLTQTQDGSGQTAPRELIHLLSCVRKSQLQTLEIGGNEPQGEALFEAAALKNALPEVSITRYQQTLLAEYPRSRQWLEKLEGQKTEQTAGTLAVLWRVDKEEALVHARVLAEIGFFKERRSKRGEPTFWVPFLYRDALRMIQGSAK